LAALGIVRCPALGWGPPTPNTGRQVPTRTGRWHARAGTLSVRSCCGVPGHHPVAPTPPRCSLASFAQAFDNGTGAKGEAPVPWSGPSVGGCLYACGRSEREGRSAIPAAAGTVCMIRTSSTHQLGSLLHEVCCPTLLRCCPDGTESIPHGRIRRVQPQLGEWGATLLTNLPEVDERSEVLPVSCTLSLPGGACHW
jgi:hypothetical protein